DLLRTMARVCTSSVYADGALSVAISRAPRPTSVLECCCTARPRCRVNDAPGGKCALRIGARFGWIDDGASREAGLHNWIAQPSPTGTHEPVLPLGTTGPRLCQS